MCFLDLRLCQTKKPWRNKISEAVVMDRCRSEIPKEWFVCGLKSKERELSRIKVVRNAVSGDSDLLHHNREALANGIFKYFPQQTMTLSEHELEARLTAKEQTQTANRIYAAANVVLDFLKWNLHICDKNTNRVSTWLDEIHGTPGLYTFTHEFFNNALTYLSPWFHDDSGLDRQTCQ